MNPYEVLGVTRLSSIKDIRAAFRKLSKEVHPDKQGGDKEKFQLLEEAQAILLDPERRKRYDATGRTDKSPVTPEAVNGMIRNTIKAMVHAQRSDGTTDNPDWEDLRNKVLLTIQSGRRQIKQNKMQTEKKMIRTQKLIKRWKPTQDADPVGDALRDELASFEAEMRQHEDALEMSNEVEKVFKTYNYVVGPDPEGQVDPGPTARTSGPLYLGSPPAQ